MIRETARARRFTVDEYERMGDLDIFRPDERLELVDGQIWVKNQLTPLEATILTLLRHTLGQVFKKGAFVRPQFPLIPDKWSMPEPDVAVVVGVPDDYLEEHPRHALLVVEISGTTLAADRGTKAAVYARAGIEDYWIVNVVENVVEVHRDPQGSRYKSMKRVTAKGSVTPLAAPKRKIPVASFLR